MRNGINVRKSECLIIEDAGTAMDYCEAKKQELCLRI
jgi:hypothetical protein